MKPGWLAALFAAAICIQGRAGGARGHAWDLDGVWQCAVCPRGESAPKEYPGVIHVPYPIGAARSRVGKRLTVGDRIWYRREFRVPKFHDGLRLHFGRVNWEANVWLNGARLGVHHGEGPFSYDISCCLRSGELQELVVGVYYPPAPPRGSAAERRHAGSWRRGPSGILKPVWLEDVK